MKKLAVYILAVVTAVSVGANVYLYQQMNAVNAACADISARLDTQLAENQKLTDELAAANTALDAANKKAADLASEIEAMQQAIKNMNSEQEKAASQPEEKPKDRAALSGNTTVTSNGYRTDDARKNFSFLTDEEYDQKITIFEKIKADKQSKNNTHYDGPLGNTMYDYLTPEEQELYIKISVNLGFGSREQIIAELEERKQTLEPPPTQFVYEGSTGIVTGQGGQASIWA